MEPKYTKVNLEILINSLEAHPGLTPNVFYGNSRGASVVFPNELPNDCFFQIIFNDADNNTYAYMFVTSDSNVVCYVLEYLRRSVEKDSSPKEVLND